MSDTTPVDSKHPWLEKKPPSATLSVTEGEKWIAKDSAVEGFANLLRESDMFVIQPFLPRIIAERIADAHNSSLSVTEAHPTWLCGCGATNGVNLVNCGVCTRPRGESEMPTEAHPKEEKPFADWQDDPEKVRAHAEFTADVSAARGKEVKLSDQNELLPCPFCGSVRLVPDTVSNTGGNIHDRRDSSGAQKATKAKPRSRATPTGHQSRGDELDGDGWH